MQDFTRIRTPVRLERVRYNEFPLYIYIYIYSRCGIFDRGAHTGNPSFLRLVVVKLWFGLGYISMWAYVLCFIKCGFSLLNEILTNIKLILQYIWDF